MSHNLFNAALAAYFLALVTAILHLFAKRRALDWAATASIVGGAILQTAYIGLRWVEAGRAPFSNMFESLVLFAWTIAVIYLLLRIRIRIPWLGAASALLSALALAHASTFESSIRPLMPALRSNWLSFHVMTCFLGYAAFALAFVAGVGYLTATRNIWFQWLWRVFTLASAGIAACNHASRDLSALSAYLFQHGSRPTHYAAGMVLALAILAAGIVEILHPIFKRNPVLPQTSEILDRIMSMVVSIGFLFLTLGILTGAVWANNAWGTYWSWDPKETWSLISWLIYAIFLHCRFTRGWRGAPAASLAIVGFLAVLFTYYGVNFWLPGLHSYAR